MGEKLIVGPLNRGFRNDRTPFVIDNDSFPTLINAYQWRGRVKRKRGTSILGRLRRRFDSTSTAYSSTSSFTFAGDGTVSLLTNGGWTLQVNGNIIPGTVSIVGASGPTTYTDPSMNGSLSPSGTINYATGLVTIPAQAGQTGTASFQYYPNLPVMGLEDFYSTSASYPSCIAFDTTYSYEILTSSPNSIYDVSFYNNPATGTYSGYTQKTTATATSWNGQDYQQFWTTNYAGALWATNGVTVPFSPTNVGMQFKPITTVDNITGGPPATADLTITGHGLVVGDFVFINEVSTTTGINFQTGYVTTVVSANKVTVTFPNATIASNGSGGIAQYLTSRSDTTKDCLRWFNGDPINSGGTFVQGSGWVNFMPPISNANFSIADLPAKQYYLVGAKAIFPFKDRLVFFGPVIQASTGNPIYLQDTIVYSQNGTPYYTASFSGSVTSASTTFNPILVPSNQTATANSYFSDVVGFGGFLTVGVDQPINTVSSNEDVLIVGFTRMQARMVYTGNDIVPFNFYTINSELGSGSTFSAINLDKGVVSKGSRGYVITSQTGTERIDLPIPDQVFQVNLTNNGSERICAQRDYINEWIYFTYPSNEQSYSYPNQSLLYNYRDNSWALINECYTTYGTFRKQSGGYTWATVGETYPTWNSWNTPWDSGNSTELNPQIIGGNQQGFVLIKEGGSTYEANSLEITSIQGQMTITGATQANPCVLTLTTPIDLSTVIKVGQAVYISDVVGMTQLNTNSYAISAVGTNTISISVNSSGFGAYVSGGTVDFSVYSPNHCLNNGDYIIVNSCIGDMSAINGNIYSIEAYGNNNFFVDPDITTTGSYFGGGLIQRMYVPFIQTKQFPTAWGIGRKTRIGPQQYLFSTTSSGQITLLIYLSEGANYPYNQGGVVPSSDVQNSSLVYSTVLYTCPESTNIGLTPANTNLQMVTAPTQQQIWHRMNTSLLGDTVQIGFTLNDSQMRDTNKINQFAEIEFHAMVLDISPSQMLA